MKSRAHELYHQITEAADPAHVLNDMVASKRAETEFLEFKGAGRIAERQIKECWSQALSGFGNTEGGVLVWGIRAARVEHPDDPSRKIDVATDFDLAPTPATFSQLLKDVLLEACIEPILGIEIRAIQYDSTNSSGFVVCLIPEGKHKPYRAGLDPAKQYYLRIGDNFVVIPHSPLRSLFFPQTAPHLKLRIQARKHIEVMKGKIDFDATIENVGQATARDVCVQVETPVKAVFSAKN